VKMPARVMRSAADTDAGDISKSNRPAVPPELATLNSQPALTWSWSKLRWFALRRKVPLMSGLREARLEGVAHFQVAFTL
jgi:hypothetical protein